MSLTKQDLDSIGVVVKEEVDSLLGLRLAPIHQEISEIKKDLSGLREQIQELTITLDKFVKTLQDQREEFAILKKEMDQVKEFLMDKFGVKIAVQR